MKIAVYFDLPYGGGRRMVENIIDGLSKKHSLKIFCCPSKPEIKNRLLRDYHAIYYQKIIQRKLAKEIDTYQADVCLVASDPYLQAPAILSYLHTPSVFLCQEPTRAFYEHFLRPNFLPVLNKIYENLVRFVKRREEERNAKVATCIASNSLFCSESIFRSYGVDSTHIYPGVDTELFSKQKCKKKNQIVVIGNNEPQKNLRFALEIVSHIKNHRPTLVIVSPRQTDHTEHLKYAKKHKIKLLLKQGITDSELTEVYNQSLATLAISRLEPFGLSVIESLACGTPVIALNEAGFRETVTSDCGLFIPADAKEAGEMTEDFLKKIRITDLSNSAIKRAKQFSWENTVNQFEQVLYETSRLHHS